ncbi:MAG: hypothetical protein ACR2NA_00240 [Solirubrobacterales bacterium]
MAGSDGCISDTGTEGTCTDGTALDGPVSVTISPEGKNPPAPPRTAATASSP